MPSSETPTLDWLQSSPLDWPEAAQAIVDLFNELLEVDPVAAQTLFSIRVPCTTAVENHPRFIANGHSQIGILGIINGLFSESHRVAHHLAEDGFLDGFRVVDIT